MSNIAIEPIERPVAVEHSSHAEHAGAHDHDHGHGDGHHGPAFLHHHFTDVAQQRESNQLGMWVFMVTEIMTFGALFFVYTLYRHLYDVQAHEAGMLSPYGVGSHLLNNNLGFANTLVLLTSSLTVATAVHAAGLKNKKLLLTMMGVTWVLGAIFLGVKAVEWTADYHEGLVPGLNWQPREVLAHKGFVLASPTGVSGEAYLPNLSGGAPETIITPANGKEFYEATLKGLETQGATENINVSNTSIGEGAVKAGEGAAEEHHEYRGVVNGMHMQMFYVIYFTMTGLHAIHMIIGLGLLATYIFHARRGMFTNEANDQPVEIFGLYWHFVDIVWVFFYPLLYLGTVAHLK